MLWSPWFTTNSRLRGFAVTLGDGLVCDWVTPRKRLKSRNEVIMSHVMVRRLEEEFERE